MSRRISLALAIHNHQPVGNFGWVFDEVYEKAYEPMVAALERHPGISLSLHYTGSLLDWLRTNRPEFIGRLQALVERGQVEILGGGYYEPVLASLDVHAGGRFGMTAPIRIPVAPADADVGKDQSARRTVEIPEYIRQQWERRGYKVSLERRYVFARLPDGRQVAVPVEQVHVNPVHVTIN